MSDKMGPATNDPDNETDGSPARGCLFGCVFSLLFYLALAAIWIALFSTGAVVPR